VVSGTTKKRGRRELSDDAAVKVREVATSLLTSRFAGNKAEMGRHLGISGSGVLYLVEGTTRASRATAERLAELAGVPLGSLLGEEPMATASSSSVFDPTRARFPGLEICLLFHDGGETEWSPATIAAARAGAYADDAPPREWMRRLEELETRISALQGAAPKPEKRQPRQRN
jgi:hypothetical protein